MPRLFSPPDTQLASALLTIQAPVSSSISPSVHNCTLSIPPQLVSDTSEDLQTLRFRNHIQQIIGSPNRSPCAHMPACPNPSCPDRFARINPNRKSTYVLLVLKRAFTSTASTSDGLANGSMYTSGRRKRPLLSPSSLGNGNKGH